MNGSGFTKCITPTITIAIVTNARPIVRARSRLGGAGAAVSAVIGAREYASAAVRFLRSTGQLATTGRGRALRGTGGEGGGEATLPAGRGGA